MKHLFYLLITAVLVFSSCVSDDDSEPIIDLGKV